MKKYIAAILIMACSLVLFACTGETEQHTKDSASVTKQSSPSAAETVETDLTPPANENSSETAESFEKREKNAMQIQVSSADYTIIYELNDSTAARQLYAQLPLKAEAEPFGGNEITFYPPEKLNTVNTPLSGGETGSLSYYEPWGDVVMFYAPCPPNSSLYELGSAVSGIENIEKLTGEITVSVYETAE